MKRFVLFAILIHFTFYAKSQLVVSNTLPPSELINDVLLGAGVEAENITFNGSGSNTISTQFGTFNAQNSNIGLQQGIILATGGITVAESPNDLPTAHVLVPEADELTSEPDLAHIMNPAVLHDVAVVEFDFTPHGDTLRFSYVFASEEYNEHTCSAYNDAFGFFISGPGISGNPNYENNAQNVALVPGSNVPVAINTVNQGFAGAFGANSICDAESANWQANSIYFVNNEANTDLNATQFDGFTQPMNVEIPVVCGATYHIKIAIADATDRKNDSAVFIKAGSFGSNAPLDASVEILQPDTSGNGVEGCSTYRLHLSRMDSTAKKTVYLRTAGLDNPDAVLPNFPDSVTFYLHDGVKTIDLQTADNGIFEGMRDFSIQILQPEVCALDTAIIDLPVHIVDFPEMTVAYSDSIGLDCIENGTVNISVSGGYEPYTINWNQPQAQGFNFSSSPDSVAHFTGVITDQCDLHSENLNIIVYRMVYDSVVVSIPDTISFNCATPIHIQPEISGGYGDYNYTWSQGNEVLSNALELTYLISDTTPLIFQVTDLCMPVVKRTVFLISQINPLVVNLGVDTTGSCVEPVVIVPEVYGGFGQISYLWKLNNLPFSSSPTFSSTLSETSGISLLVTDGCNQSASDELMVAIDHEPIHVELPTDTVVCEGERLVLDPNVSGGYGGFQYKWNDVVIGDGIYSVIPKRNNTYSFSVSDDCGASVDQNVEVNIKRVHADFEFDFEHNPVRLVNHSTKNCWYNWSFKNGLTSNKYTPVVDNQDLIGGRVYLVVRNSIGCEAEVSQFCNPPVRVFIPTAFTPDGDGVNDIFKAEGSFISTFEMEIFDRWGNLVFQSSNINEGWDGTAKNSEYSGENEVYTYKYRATDLSGVVHEATGIVQLLR